MTWNLNRAKKKKESKKKADAMMKTFMSAGYGGLTHSIEELNEVRTIREEAYQEAYKEAYKAAKPKFQKNNTNVPHYYGAKDFDNGGAYIVEHDLHVFLFWPTLEQVERSKMKIGDKFIISENKPIDFVTTTIFTYEDNSMFKSDPDKKVYKRRKFLSPKVSDSES